ncbi:SusD-like starch-binding protein associating with outer membrane [Chitinophaga skermanii]|uniref:SusD-like starch-binding protein associating with outer membrane n=1 Tax=Chitinophaga skermanii TaxID=331697 RepID=A0A327QFN7_9BACT|nr:RagB/SusD family nutrient uptake outer membrane protein [Chitinophaga skermanii]RAJ00497.1 SusD-like starch-binding protein associating with outer membrane [Chitinophaga skermanii]
MKKLLYICTLSGLFLTTACSKDFLDTNPQQNTDADMVIKDIASTRAAINGIYSLMQNLNNYGRTTILLPDIMSDNAFISKKNQNRYLSYDQYITTESESYAAGQWNQLYRVIANTNLLIAKAEANTYPSSDSAEVQHIIGEAYALRALAHFNLVRFYALPYNATPTADHLGVPVVTKNATSKEGIISPKRNTVKEVYTQIISDFNTAMQRMPRTPVGFKASMRGKMGYYGTKALLARVQLYREDYVAADSLANDVITKGGFALITRDKLIDDSKKQNSTESIFEIQFNTLDNLGSDALVNIYWQSGSYGDALSTEDLFNAYTATDIRKTFITKGKRSGGENPAWLVTKYTNNTNFEEPSRVIRLAEVYLIRAEARAHTGKEALALADLNTIAARGDDKLVPYDVVGTALTDAILNERRKELAFEGHRLFDLTRTKKSFTKYRSATTIAINYPNGRTILPIPQAEMKANTNMEQNDAYKPN